MNIPAKNGNGAVFQLSAVTLPDTSQAQAVVLVGADGNPIASWPLPSGAATESGLQSILAKLNGTVAVTLASAPLPSGAATEAKLEQVRALLATTLGVSVSNFPATQTVTGSVAVSNFPASPSDYPSVDIGARADAAASSDSGTFSLIALVKRGLASLTSILNRTTALVNSRYPVEVGNFPASQPVTGTFWQSVQPVSVTSLPLPSGAATSTDVQAVRDRLPATPHSQPLTDAQLRASPVPITGSISVTPAPGAATEAAQNTGNTSLANIEAAVQVEDSPAVSGASGIPMLAVRHDSDTITADNGDWTTPKLDEEGRMKVATKPASFPVVAGALTTAGNTLACDVRRASNVVFHVKNTGTVTLAAGTFVFEASLDSTDGTDGTWFGIQAVRSNANTIETSIALSGMNAGAGWSASWEASVNGYSWMRLRCSVNVTASSIAFWTIQRGSYATEPIPAAQVSSTQTVSFSALPTPSGSPINTTASTNATSIKSSAGTVYNISVFNPSASPVFVKLYNKSSAPTVGTDVPSVTIPCAAGELRVADFGALGRRYGTGIALAATGAAAVADTTAAPAGVQIHLTQV